jgi:RNase P/RNase MRP subunit POP5
MPKKQPQPARKLPRKSKRPKRRYLLFGLKSENPLFSQKQAFDAVMGACRHSLGAEALKKEGIWFIVFNPQGGRGIVRCSHKSVSAVKEAVDGIEGAETLLVSGTLRKIKSRL